MVTLWGKSWLIIIIILVIGVGFGAMWALSNQPWFCPRGITEQNTISPTPQEQEATSTPKQANITVLGLIANQEVSLPLAVTGEGRVFENVVSIRLRDAKGTLFQGFTMAQSPDVGLFGPFEKTISYINRMPSSQDVTLDVYWNSPKDGAELDVVSIPLRLKTDNLTPVQLFFGNNKLDPQNTCTKVFPMARIIPKTQTPAQDAIALLLDASDLSSNYFTSINQGVKLNKLTIAKGVAKIDFDQKLQEGVGGSCRVSAIRAQITETLKQFSIVKSVVISIDGKTEGILQP